MAHPWTHPLVYAPLPPPVGSPQLVACLKEEVEALGVVNAEAWIESGQKMETPYGQRLEWLLPCGTPMAVHLKDPGLVKSKKRWSQVMYMYYLLQFRVPREHPRDTSASYILTTDADIMFNPEDVQALVVLLSRDKRVGACCGRTFAKGSGPIYWYQIFDYAVGHWFQKTCGQLRHCCCCCCCFLGGACAVPVLGVARAPIRPSCGRRACGDGLLDTPVAHA